MTTQGELPSFFTALRSAAEKREFDPTDLSLTTVFGGRNQQTDASRNSPITTCSAVLSWPACLNDLVACAQYVDTLVKTCEEEFEACWSRPEKRENEKDKQLRDKKGDTSL